MKALVLFSGGVDSTTCLGLAVKKYGADNVTALSVSYGQKHIKEIEAAAAITKYYGTERIELDLSLIFQYSDCSLLKNSEQNIPHESYSEHAMNTAIYEGSGRRLEISAPFVGMSKAEVVKLGLSLDVPYELTWSCYEGGDRPCGKCGTCIDRAKAFKLNGIKDPAER